MQHDAGTGRDEEQRQVLQQGTRPVPQLLTDAATREQGQKEERHADDRAGNRQGKGANDQFADELVEEQQGEDLDHRNGYD